MKKPRTFKDFEEKIHEDRKESRIEFVFDDDHCEIHGHTNKKHLHRFLFFALIPSLKQVLKENFDDTESLICLAKWCIDLDDLKDEFANDD